MSEDGESSMNGTNVKVVTTVIMVQLAAAAACWHTDTADCPTFWNGCSLDHLQGGGSNYPWYRFAKPGESGLTDKAGDGIQHCVYICDDEQYYPWYTGATLSGSRCTGTATGTGSGS